MRVSSPHSVLIIDDDERFATTLAQALSRRGFVTQTAHDIATAMAAAAGGSHDAAIVDLRLGDEDGLGLVAPLRTLDPHMRILVLTGYAAIATAVKAIKLGANDYLAKPVTATDVEAALTREAGPETRVDDAGPLERMSPRRLEWEHIQRVLVEHAGNVSATARTLRMHRRTLQRKLAKRPTQR
jgi:two-component system response regulator RegA